MKYHAKKHEFVHIYLWKTMENGKIMPVIGLKYKVIVNRKCSFALNVYLFKYMYKFGSVSLMIQLAYKIIQR
jgi:hypothetical protein